MSLIHGRTLLANHPGLPDLADGHTRRTFSGAVPTKKALATAFPRRSKHESLPRAARARQPGIDDTHEPRLFIRKWELIPIFHEKHPTRESCLDDSTLYESAGT